MSSALRIAVSQEQGKVPVTVLHLIGEIDANTQQEFEDKAGEAIAGGAENLLLDLSEVTYMSSAGFRAMHAIAGKLGASGQGGKTTNPKLFKPSAAVSKVIKTLGFDTYFDIHQDLDEALNAF